MRYDLRMMEEPSEERKRAICRRLQVLKEEMEAGRVHFAPHLMDEMKSSLLAVRYGSDGEIDLDTVNARARALALGVEALRNREDTKRQVSLAEIQHTYFDWLDKNFGNLHKMAVDAHKNPHEFARAASRDPKFVEEVVGVIPQFMEVLTQFWSNLGEPAHIHLEDANFLKAIFGGDLFPSAFQNIASTCGIYVDTIVLPDPFLRSANMFDRWSEERRTYYFVKHALNVLKYRELALADLDPPIVAVVPDRSAIDETMQDLIGRVARADAIVHASKIFGTQFSSFDEAVEYVDRFDDFQAVVDALAEPNRVLFDTDWEGSLIEQMHRVLEEQPEWRPFIERPGRIVLFQSVGRMGQANDMLLRTQRLSGTPLVEALTSWRYFQWKLEYDAARLPDAHVADLHVVRAMQAASNAGRVPWLGRVPPDTLIKLRKDGAIAELRALVNDGVGRLASADPSNFQQTAELVVANFDKMFADHEDQVRRLTDRLRRFGVKDVGSWVVIGGIEITAAATGMPLYGLAAIAGNQLLDVPKLKDFPEMIRRLVEDAATIRRSPVGLLFQHRD
jgi:hypothetical protein